MLTGKMVPMLNLKVEEVGMSISKIRWLVRPMLVGYFTLTVVIFANEIYAQEAKNLLQNPGFEEVGPEDIPQHWCFARKATPITIDPTTSHSGKNSVRMIVTEENKSTKAGYFNQLMFRAKEGEVYRISFWFKTKDAKNWKGWSSTDLLVVSPISEKIGMDWANKSGVSAVLSAEWRYAAKEFMIKRDDYLCLLIRSSLNTFLGTIWFDDICLERIHPEKKVVSEEIGKNLLRNAGFEKGSENNPQDWNFSTHGRKEGAATPLWDKTIFHSGKASIKLKGSIGYFEQYNIPVKSGGHYRLSGFVKGKGGTLCQGMFLISIYDNKNKILANQVFPTPLWRGIYNWEYTERDFLVPENAHHITFYCNLSIGGGKIGDGEDTVWLDDVKLVEVKKYDEV